MNRRIVYTRTPLYSRHLNPPGEPTNSTQRELRTTVAPNPLPMRWAMTPCMPILTLISARALKPAIEDQGVASWIEAMAAPTSNSAWKSVPTTSHRRVLQGEGMAGDILPTGVPTRVEQPSQSQIQRRICHRLCQPTTPSRQPAQVQSQSQSTQAPSLPAHR